jgi:hypothetical protein
MEFRVICFQENGLFVAQGLEHDICVQAESLEELFGRFEVAVKLESDESGGLNHIDAAPSHFHAKWERRSADLKPRNDNDADYPYTMAMAA